MEKEQIIKALECCTNPDVDSCSKCPIYPLSLNMTQTECMETAMRNALALIKSQDEQVFKLENRIAECENGYSQTLALERARIKELSAENKMLRLLRADDGLAVVDYAVDSIRAMKFNTARKMQEALKERIKGIYLDEDEMCAVIDEVAEKILNVKHGG